MLEENNLNHFYKNGLLIGSVGCDWKCLKEQGLSLSICQNSHLSNTNIKYMEISELISIFKNNLLSECVIFAGLEPMLQFQEVYEFIRELRKTDESEVLIFTGYYPFEIKCELEKLREFKNIIIKYGRYSPLTPERYDSVLKIKLASLNQWAEKIS